MVAGLVAIALLLLVVAAALARTRGGSSDAATQPSTTSATSTPPSSGSGSTSSANSATVVSKVPSGDVVWLNHGTTKVRLLQIDAPDAATNQCYAKQSIAALTKLAGPGTTVKLARDPKLPARDRFGRLERYVSVAGKDINLAMVSEGAAAPYFFFGHRGTEAKQLLTAAREARAAGRGLWGACPGTPFNPNHEVKTS